LVVSSRHTEIVPLWILDGSAGDLEVVFDYTPGGFDDDEDKLAIKAAFYILDDGYTAPCFLAEHEEDRVIDWLAGEWEPPQLRGEAA
jgi:hypothetical protein